MFLHEEKENNERPHEKLEIRKTEKKKKIKKFHQSLIVNKFFV